MKYRNKLSGTAHLINIEHRRRERALGKNDFKLKFFNGISEIYPFPATVLCIITNNMENLASNGYRDDAQQPSKIERQRVPLI